MTRQEFNGFIRVADLGDRATRQRVNGVALDEILDTRQTAKQWDVKGCAPLTVSGQEYLRPCPRVVLGDSGWQVKVEQRWFCD
jgi:hypothetical protein